MENEKCPKTKEKAGLGYLAFKEVSAHILALLDPLKRQVSQQSFFFGFFDTFGFFHQRKD
jgi:hypothetical protein